MCILGDHVDAKEGDAVIEGLCWCDGLAEEALATEGCGQWWDKSCLFAGLGEVSDIAFFLEKASFLVSGGLLLAFVRRKAFVVSYVLQKMMHLHVL